MGTPLSDAMVEALATRTEGWAAGLQLAALSLRGQPDVGAFIEAFTGSHRYVLDYLAEEVLERQTDDMREFLLETSVLERLSGPLCDVVTGRGDSQARLEAVDAAGLFLVALDDVRGWWRYHHLFADLLRVRLKQQTDRTARLHRAAAAWYEEQGLTDDAIHHTLEGGETVWAARLIEEHFDTLFNLRGEEATIRRWLPALPRDLVSRRPRLLLAQAQMAAMRGDVDTMEPLVDAAERSAGHAPGDPYEPTAGRSASLLVNVPAVMALQRSYIAQLRGDAEATAGHTARAAALVNPDELMLLSAVEGFRGVSEWLRGNLDAAERTFASSIGRWRSAGQVTTAAWGAYSLARLQRAQGRLDAVVRTCRQALEFSSTTDGALLPAAGPAFVGLGQVEYQRDHLDAALDHVTTGVTLSRQFVHTPPLAAGLITLAWIHQATGDRATALGLVREAEGLAPGPPGLLNPVPAQRARLMLAQGALESALRWTTRAGPRRRRRAGLWARTWLLGTGKGVARAEPHRPSRVPPGAAPRRGSPPGPGRQRHRSWRPAGPGAGGRRRSGRGHRRAGHGPRTRLPTRLCQGVRRRRPLHGGPARLAHHGTRHRPQRPGYTAGPSDPATTAI